MRNNNNKIIQPSHYCMEAVKPTTWLWMKLNEQTITCSSSQNVSSKRKYLLNLVLIFVWGLNDNLSPFLPIGISFDLEGALAPGKARFWMFITPVWAPENKAWDCISFVEGAPAPDDFGDFVVFTAAPLRIFLQFVLLSMRCDSIAVKIFWILMTTQLSDSVMWYTTVEQCFYAGFTNGVITDFSTLGDLHIIGCAGQESPDLVFAHWSVQDPNFIFWMTVVVYCQEKRLSGVFASTGRLEMNCL